MFPLSSRNKAWYHFSLELLYKMSHKSKRNFISLKRSYDANFQVHAFIWGSFKNRFTYFKFQKKNIFLILFIAAAAFLYTVSWTLRFS